MLARLKSVSPIRRWGALACTAALLALLIIRVTWTGIVGSRWEIVKLDREKALVATIQDTFLERLQGLANVASSLADDPRLQTLLTSNDADLLIEGNTRLDQSRTDEVAALSVLDPNGNLVAWAGRRAFDDARSFVATPDRDTTVILSRMDLRSAVSVCVAARNRKLLIVASAPLDVSVPIASRFVDQKTIATALSSRAGVEVEILVPWKTEESADKGAIRVGLVDFRGTIVATALVSLPALEQQLRSFTSAMDALLGFIAALLSLLVAWELVLQLQRSLHGIASVAAIALVIWSVRFLWLTLGTPGSLIGGMLFDPAVYASPFGNGIASSLGETLISVIALLGSIVPLVALVVRAPGKKRVSAVRAVISFLGSAVMCFGLVIVLRAYGASLRSFIVDSTLRFVDVSVFLPEAGVLFMYLVVMLLTAALVLAVIAVLGWMIRRLSDDLSVSDFWAIVLAAVLYSLAVAIFTMVNRVPQFPLFTPFVVLLCSLTLVFRMRHGGMSSLLNLPGLLLLFASVFVISVPVLDQKVHAKESERLRVYADEVVRPVDAWLSFVVSESYRSLAGSLSAGGKPLGEEAREIAFPMWSRTLLSREGYNSALVFYAIDGTELSRFCVGLTTYEQTQLLTRLFDVAEERLNVVERRVPEGLIKYYGMWGTVRDDDGKPLAIAAVLLSASERALFRGEAPELLRTLSPWSSDPRYRQVTISEWQNGFLVASNDETLTPGTIFPERIRNLLAEAEERSVVQIENKAGRSFETLYVKDEAQQDRIVSISVAEVGLRWHMFNILKVAMIYGAVMLLGSSILVAIGWKRYRPLLFGFRGKLLLAFLVVALIPLVVFGYYNKEFAAERQSVSLLSRLNEDLDLLHQRLMASMNDEEDFTYGITSDFCEVLASDYGIDFTVYQRAEMQASSRPELYQAGILDNRLPGTVFAEVLVAGRGYAQTSETIGNVEYAVGYRPLVFNGKTLGVLSVPTLSRQQEIETELAERNAFTLGVYGMLLMLTIALGAILANQLSSPIRALTGAARDVGRGKLDVEIAAAGSDELSALVGTFNEMVLELKKSREELSRVEREKAWKEMAKQVAHEIKNPLTPMKLSVQHLRQAFKDRAPDLDEIVTRVTTTITEQIDALARIATEFSRFARMPERMFERIELHGFLSETVRLFTEVDGIEFRIKFCDTEPVLIADRDELRRVFVNLIRNSVQAMEEGGTITMETAINDHRCIIRLSDTGSGIPKEIVPKVFQPNFSTKTDGMGLGLAMVRKTIEDLNGTVDLESVVGRGTTIEIILPLQ